MSATDDQLINDAFSSLNDKLNTDFKSVDTSKALERANTQIEVIDNQVKELDSVLKSNVLPDEDYLREQVKFLVEECKGVLQKLKLELRIGSSEKMFSAWAEAVNATTNLLSELRSMNTEIVNIVAKKENVTNKPAAGKGNVNMTLDSLLELLVKAEKSNSMSAIDATFEVQEETKE